MDQRVQWKEPSAVTAGQKHERAAAKRVWTRSQASAIETLDQDVCVAAGAGSGKTGVLVERVLRILQESAAGGLPERLQARMDQILVITFTDRATREMKQRLVSALEDRGLTAERRALETAWISTIHGFCSRLLKENPFEAGVDPAFTVMDEGEARRLLRAQFESVLEEAFAAGDGPIVELATAAQNERLFGADVHDPLSALFAAADSCLARLRGAGVRLEMLTAALAGGPEDAARRALQTVCAWLNPRLEEAANILAGLAASNPPLGSLAAKRGTLLGLAARIRPCQPEQGWQPLCDALSALSEAHKAAAGTSAAMRNGSPADAEAAERMDGIRGIWEECSKFKGLTPDAEERAALVAWRFLSLVERLWAAGLAHRRQLGVLDNDDLPAEALRLLTESEAVQRRCRRQFRHILVDEFQDTDPIQMEIVRRLHDPEGPGSDPPNTLFIVGDVQQSIYGFRNAEARLFQELEREFRCNGRGVHITMAENFRARPELLALVNRLFAQAWCETPTAFTPLQAASSFDPPAGPCIEILVARGTSREAAVAAEAAAIARRVGEMISDPGFTLAAPGHRDYGRPVQCGHIAVLLRQLTNVDAYEDAFGRAGIPCFVVGGGRGYYARQEIRDVMCALTVVDSPLDDVALVATLRSPLCGASADTLFLLARRAREAGRDEPLYPHIRGLVESGSLPAEEKRRLQAFVDLFDAARAEERRIPVGRLLERIVVRSGYDARLLLRPNGRRRLANVRKLLQMANTSSACGVAEFIGRLRDLERLTDREGDAPTVEEHEQVVRIITIHKAKGLEFPVVFLADMGRQQPHNDRDIFVCDPGTLAIGSRAAGCRSAAYIAISDARFRREQDESVRLLYVAMTRAQEHLVLCGSLPASRPQSSWAGQVFPELGVLRAPLEPEVREVCPGLTVRAAPC